MDIYNGIRRHSGMEKVSFHMPGHKAGRAFVGTPFENDLFRLDTTELPGTDCLMAPEGIIKKSQEHAAALYGAKQAFYLVNGSTCGILAMFYACFRESDTVLADRNCHRSVLNAMILAGVRPIWLAPDWDATLCTAGRVPCSLVEEQFRQNRNIKGIFLTSPNYYGICSDVAEIARIAHQNGAVLLVDEAHGAHFPFSSRFPANAMAQGADICVTSLHKTLPAPNQTALLLVGERLQEKAEIADAVCMFQTTSPSYLLMSYMDAALDYAERYGGQRTEELLPNIEKIPHLPTDDPLKVIVSFSERGYSGYETEQLLREQFGIFAELCDTQNVLFMVSWGNTKEDFTLLEKALRFIKELPDKSRIPIPIPPVFAAHSHLSPKEVSLLPREEACAENAAGRVCAAAVTAFPPCIPILLPGEIITDAHISYIKELRRNHLVVTGMNRDCFFVVSE